MIREPTRVLLLSLAVLVAACSETRAPDARPAPAAAGAAGRLGAAELDAWIAAGAERIPVDLRPPQDFARGHLAGAINLQSGYGQFALRAGRFFPARSRLCLMSDDPEEAHRLAATLPDACWLGVPVATLAQRPEGWDRQRTLTPEAAAALLAKREALLIDARTAGEYAAGHVPGAVFVYPDDFPRQAGFLRPDRPIVVTCEEGWRSSLLVSWLDRAGFAQAMNLIGGMKAWRSRSLPLETGAEQKAFR